MGISVSAYIVFTVTILAFIFLPTNLTASVFGMNVQEINNTGKSIRIFIVTAILLISVAVTAWFLTNLARAIWHSEDHESPFIQDSIKRSRKERFKYATKLLGNPKAWKDMPWGTLMVVVTNGRLGWRRAGEVVMSARKRQKRRDAERKFLQLEQRHPTRRSAGEP